MTEAKLGEFTTLTALGRCNDIALILDSPRPKQCFPVWRAGFRQEGGRHEQNLGTFEYELSVKLRESNVVRDAQAEVPYRWETGLGDSVSFHEGRRLACVSSPWIVQVDVEHVHFSVLRSDVAFFIDYRVCQIVLLRLTVVLREAAERQPDLVIERELLVLREQVSLRLPIELIPHLVFTFIGMVVFRIHVGEVLRQTDHLCTFLSTFPNKPLANIKVLFNVIWGLELD